MTVRSMAAAFCRRSRGRDNVEMRKMTVRSMTISLGVAAAAACAASLAVTVGAQSEPGDGPRYVNGDELVRPDDYREWMFLSSGLGMTYEAERVGEAGSGARPMRFQNVFVNRSAYAGFAETGEWPDGSIFVLEIREAASESSINVAGSFQSRLLSLEAEVKDSRFEDGWAFYAFGRAGSMPDAAAPLTGDEVARCVECHTDHTAVERTFVQFYPTLLEIARDKGTLNPGFE